MSADQTSFTETTIAAMEAARGRRLVQWTIRSVISATILVWLSSRYPWAKWILYVWMLMAALGLALILFLPQLLRNRLLTMERRLMEVFDPSVYGDGFAIEDREVTWPVPLETQLEKFRGVGIELDSAHTIEELEALYDRATYEDRPYGTLLMALGSEAPSGKGSFSHRVWNFDARCIEGSGSYVKIVESLARISGAADRVTELRDEVDLEAETGTLSYRLDGELRELEPTIEDDWADGAVMTEVMADFVGDNSGFYGVDNGEGSVIVYLDKDKEERLTELMQRDVLLIA